MDTAEIVFGPAGARKNCRGSRGEACWKHLKLHTEAVLRTCWIDCSCLWWRVLTPDRMYCWQNALQVFQGMRVLCNENFFKAGAPDGYHVAGFRVAWQHAFCSVTHPYIYLLRYQGSHGLWLQRQIPQQLRQWRCAQLRVPIAAHRYLGSITGRVDQTLSAAPAWAPPSYLFHQPLPMASNYGKKSSWKHSFGEAKLRPIQRLKESRVLTAAPP